MMALGEKAKLYIPSHKGYGANGFPAWGYPLSTTIRNPNIIHTRTGTACLYTSSDKIIITVVFKFPAIIIIYIHV